MAAEETSERDLVERSLRGDPAAFEDLFRRHFGAVYRYALTLAGDEAESEDLTQEAFIRAHANLPRLGPPWNFRAWVFRILRNHFVDRLRRAPTVSSLEMEGPLAAPGTRPEDRLLKKEDAERVQRAVRALPAAHREALVLREVYDFAYGDIASLMGISLANVKVTLHRARLGLQKAYGMQLILEEPTPDCAGLQELLSVNHDGESLGAKETLFRQHLRTCQACQRRQERLRAVSGLFALLPPPLPPGGLAGKILEQLAHSPVSTGKGVPKGPAGEASPGFEGGGSGMGGAWKWGLAAGIGVVVVIGLVALGWSGYQFLRYRGAGGLPESGGPELMVSIQLDPGTVAGEIGQALIVPVYAAGPSPIESVELWIGGQLAAVQGAPSGGLSVWETEFTWAPISPGIFPIMARVVDAAAGQATSDVLVFPVTGNVATPGFVMEDVEEPIASPGGRSAQPGPSGPEGDSESGPAAVWQGGLGDWLGSLGEDDLPLAPELAVAGASCQVELAVHDLSHDEDGFLLRRQTLGQSGWTDLATLEGQSTHEWLTYDDSPPPGGVVYLAAAFNGAGESQSNPVTVNLDPSDCPDAADGQATLGLEITGLFPEAAAEAAYCYYSLNGVNWLRWPESGFVMPGEGGIAGEGLLASFPMLEAEGVGAPETLDLKLSCWGWLGGNLIHLGEVGLEEIDLSHLGEIQIISGELSVKFLLGIKDLLQFPFGSEVMLNPEIYEFLALRAHPKPWNMPFLNAAVFDDPQQCTNHLEPEAQNFIVAPLLCAPYPGKNLGPGGPSPQMYFVWFYLNNTCPAGMGPMDCLSFAEWLNFAETHNGELYFEIQRGAMDVETEDVGAGIVTYREPERSVYVLPPNETCSSQWVPVARVRFVVEGEVYDKDDILIDVGPWVSTWSNWVEYPCQAAIQDEVWIEVTFQTLHLSDQSDNGITSSVREAYGSFSVYAPPGDVPDGVAEFDNDLCGPVNWTDASVCLKEVTNGDYSIAQAYLERCQGDEVDPSHWCLGNFGFQHNVLHVAVPGGEEILITAGILDDDDPGIPDFICMVTYHTGARSLFEWAATQNEAVQLYAPHNNGTCAVDVVLNAVPGP